MKYLFLLLTIISPLKLLSKESIDTVQWVNNVLYDLENEIDSSLDSVLIVVKESPKNEYKKALSKSVKFFSEEKNYAYLRSWYQLLMAYNDNWSYNAISNTIIMSNNCISFAKCFCEAYDNNKNELYAPLREKFEFPDFISDFYVLKKSDLNDFKNHWIKCSSICMERDKYNPINMKVQEYYRWKNKVAEERYVRLCLIRDSLYSTNKRINRDRISELEDEIRMYEEQREANICVLPRTIDVCYTRDSFVQLEKDESLFFEGHMQFKLDSQNVIVPYLTEYNDRKVSNEDGDLNLLLLDTNITAILGKYAGRSRQRRKEIKNRFNIDVISLGSCYYTSLESITAICCPDGVVFRVYYNNYSGYYVFFPNDINAEIKEFGQWIE